MGDIPSVWSCEANDHLVAETSPNAGTIDSVLLEITSCFNYVSTRKGAVGASIPWSKRYPSRSAYIFFKGTMGGSGGISMVGTTPVVLP